MKLYLVRHGEYLQQSGGLSEKGRQDIQKLADFLKQGGIHVSHIFHSGKLRAQQTAELLSSAIHCTHGIQSHVGLNPNDDVISVANDIEAGDEDVMLVGHMPFMGGLLGKLITGNVYQDLVVFQPGTMVCLERIEHHGWFIKWMICPDLWGQN